MIRPLLVLIGGADDWTPAATCRQMADAMAMRGADASIVVYPGAYHYFDVEGRDLTVLAEVENELKPGGFGATVAYQAAAAADAQRQVEAFLAQASRPGALTPRVFARQRPRVLAWAASGPDTSMDASVELVKRLLPSVAHIHTEIPASHPSTAILGDERMGTGTIVDPAGLILTVNYVVMGGRSIEVMLERGRIQKAEIVAQDFDVGLALLRVKRQGLPAARLASSETLALGTPVFATAAMAPRERRVAGGLVTQLGEFEAYWEYMLERGVISTAPNPGFGGGPLFTLAGTMVGVVSLNLNEITRSSLAIPIECFASYRDELLRHGRVVSRPQRAWLGVFAHSPR